MYYQTRVLTGPGTGNAVITALHRSGPDTYPYILASTATGNNSRYDILFAHPQQSLELYDQDTSEIDPGFLDSLHAWWLQHRIETDDDSQVTSDPLPFTGGWFLYLGYELAAEIEPVLDLPTGDHDVLAGYVLLDPVLSRQSDRVVGRVGAGTGDPHFRVIFHLARRQLGE